MLMFSAILKRVWFLWALCVFANIVAFLCIFFKIHEDPNKIIVLHYNIILANDNFGKAKGLYELPIAAFFITALNFSLYSFINKTKTFYGPLVAGMTLLIQLIILFSAILIIKSN